MFHVNGKVNDFILFYFLLACAKHEEKLIFFRERKQLNEQKMQCDSYLTRNVNLFGGVVLEINNLFLLNNLLLFIFIDRVWRRRILNFFF